jgi:hypothetical protein
MHMPPNKRTWFGLGRPNKVVRAKKKKKKKKKKSEKKRPKPTSCPPLPQTPNVPWYSRETGKWKKQTNMNLDAFDDLENMLGQLDAGLATKVRVHGLRCFLAISCYLASL